jgi:hypothetical protein
MTAVVKAESPTTRFGEICAASVEACARRRAAARADPAAFDPAPARARVPVDHRHLPGRDLFGGDHWRDTWPQRTDDACERGARALTGTQHRSSSAPEEPTTRVRSPGTPGVAAVCVGCPYWPLRQRVTNRAARTPVQSCRPPDRSLGSVGGGSVQLGAFRGTGVAPGERVP